MKTCKAKEELQVAKGKSERAIWQEKERRMFAAGVWERRQDRKTTGQANLDQGA